MNVFSEERLLNKLSGFCETLQSSTDQQRNLQPDSDYRGDDMFAPACFLQELL